MSGYRYCNVLGLCCHIATVEVILLSCENFNIVFVYVCVMFQELLNLSLMALYWQLKWSNMQSLHHLAKCQVVCNWSRLYKNAPKHGLFRLVEVGSIPLHCTSPGTERNKCLVMALSFFSPLRALDSAALWGVRQHNASWSGNNAHFQRHNCFPMLERQCATQNRISL